MMRHFDMKRYPRERGKKLHYFGGRLFEGGLLFKEIRYYIIVRDSGFHDNKRESLLTDNILSGIHCY